MDHAGPDKADACTPGVEPGGQEELLRRLERERDEWLALPARSRQGPAAAPPPSRRRPPPSPPRLKEKPFVTVSGAARGPRTW